MDTAELVGLVDSIMIVNSLIKPIDKERRPILASTDNHIEESTNEGDRSLHDGR